MVLLVTNTTPANMINLHGNYSETHVCIVSEKVVGGSATLVDTAGYGSPKRDLADGRYEQKQICPSQSARSPQHISECIRTQVRAESLASSQGHHPEL